MTEHVDPFTMSDAFDDFDRRREADQIAKAQAAQSFDDAIGEVQRNIAALEKVGTFAESIGWKRGTHIADFLSNRYDNLNKALDAALKVVDVGSKTVLKQHAEIDKLKALLRSHVDAGKELEERYEQERRYSRSLEDLLDAQLGDGMFGRGVRGIVGAVLCGLRE